MYLAPGAVQDVIDYLCTTGIDQAMHFLWRPLLPDPKDDMVLEAAVGAGCSCIITLNTRDFATARGLVVTAIKPADFLEIFGEPTMSAMSIRLPDSLHRNSRAYAAATRPRSALHSIFPAGSASASDDHLML